MNAPTIEFRAVSVRYEAHADATIREVSFRVCAGERVALMGLNGSGKTSLLMTAVGLIAHEGEVWVCGSLLSRKTVKQAREKIGFLFNVPEDQLLFPRVIDDVSFGLRRQGWSAAAAQAQAEAALKSLGILHLATAPSHHLSHGQKQRVALAGALVSRPPLLLLDEPSSALDPPGKRDLADVLGKVEASMLVATHDLGFAERFCTRYLVLEQGRLVDDLVDSQGVRSRLGE